MRALAGTLAGRVASLVRCQDDNLWQETYRPSRQEVCHGYELELVPVPVTDVDRAKAFYVDPVGFNADHYIR